MRTLVSPKSIYNGDSRVKLLDYNGETWLNKDDKEWHQPNEGDGGGTDYGPVSLYRAMEVSANTPFIQLGMDVGVDKVKEAAIDAGIKDDKRTYAALTPTFSLGTSSPSAIDMAGAYATFAKSGLQADTYAVTKVVEQGQELYSHEKKTTTAFEPAVADTVTEMLERVIKEKHGTGTSAQLPGNRPAAGKTGTTDGNKSAWFSGYTPQLSTAIGMWRIDSATPGASYLEMFGTGGKKSVHGASFPAEIWKAYMSAALKGQAKEKFPEPQPLGEKVTGTGATSEPTYTPPPTTAPPTEPTEEPDKSTPPPSSPPPTSPDPTETCADWDWDCQSEGPSQGNDQGTDSGTNEGQEGGTSEGESDGGDSGDPGGGDDRGGTIFGHNGE